MQEKQELEQGRERCEAQQKSLVLRNSATSTASKSASKGVEEVPIKVKRVLA